MTIDRIISIVSIVVSVLVSLPSALLSYHYATVSQDRQVKIDQVSKFEETNGIVESVGDFIAALNTQGDLTEAKNKIRLSTTNEIVASERLKSAFPRVNAINNYMDAVAEFNKISQNTSSAMDIKAWIESLNTLNSRRIDVTKSVKKSI